ncbi:response regulator transcription factor [Ralstonia sp. 24A2]|uniref:response regulator transcription factor n=1 Tax=Ralstonia sp. 24A2 TaxID=3447364 RepID=UPI003F6A3D47
MRVLLVEDEPEMASALSDALARHNILVDHAANLAQATAAVATCAYSLIVLDRQLPDGDGLTLIPKLRAEKNVVPVLVLTARGDISEKVAGLNHGADDYLAKPFAVEELLARIRALVRRPANLESDVITAGLLSYEHVNSEARVGETVLDLTRREILVLEALLRRYGRMVPRSVLMEAVFALDDDVQPNALDTHVSRLRRKLADSGSGLVISGVRGVGYLLREA